MEPTNQTPEATHTNMDAKRDVEFEVPVDANLKCTEFKPFVFKGPCLIPHCGKRRRTNPHMRAFWASTLAFMFAFIGWFAFAPLLTVVRVDLGLCDNNAEIQLLPEGERIEACVCKKGCKSAISSANIAGVSFDVFTRFILGSVIEKFGPRKTDCMLLSFGAICVAASALVFDGTGLIAARFFVSCLGSTFVVNQFWNSIMFNRGVVGTANATAGGWGNLGGGLTQTLMPLFYRFFKGGLGLPMSTAWRCSMLVPAVMYTVLATWIFFCSQDTATGAFDVSILGKSKRAGFFDYVRVVSDYRVFLMIFQYSACFGCELVMNNTLATHFHDVFGVDLVAAGALAMSFGAMNLFARSLGGIASDWANARWAMQGRLWMHFLSLFGQAIFFFLFGCIDNTTGGWPAALALLIVFAIFVNAAEGTSYGIVPYMIPQDLAIVSAVVGAGGTLGAVIATWSFYKYVEDPLLSFKLHSLYVLFWALTVFAMRWEHLGSMFKAVKEVDDAEPQKQEVVAAA
jgi:NNP family nitrate/nitrite transporter-like MFS transporter